MNRTYTILLTVIVGLLIAGCAAVPSTDQQQVEMAVEATLTAVAGPADEGEATSSTPAAGEGTPAPEQEATAAVSTPQPQQPAAGTITLPPLVPDFNPEPRPAATLGDPDAPIVMYEWSDYT